MLFRFSETYQRVNENKGNDKDALFPVPGGPCRRYPLRCGMPASTYQSSVTRKSWASRTNVSTTPSCRITELDGVVDQLA
jgi:hypothetical protein